MDELNYRDQAINLLATGFASPFAEFCSSDERMHDLMMELSTEFVEKEIPIVKEEDSIEMACQLICSVTLQKI